MTAKREILFAAHRIPYPPDKGDKIRSWRLLNHLAARFDVHLCAFVDDRRDFFHRKKLETVCKSVALVALGRRAATLRSVSGLFTGEPLSFTYYRNARMKEYVNKARARDLAGEIVFSSSMAPYMSAGISGRARIVDLCDADSEKWRQYARERHGPMKWIYGREGRRLAGAETEIINWADAALAISESEAAILNAREGVRGRAGWFGNGVDAEYFSPDAAALNNIYPDVNYDVVFTGAMDYQANIDAIAWFADHVWPRITAAMPGARLVIVGANPARRVRVLARREGIEVTGRVDDIRRWIAGAKIAIAPLRIARGVQNKVLEAMAMARPVVATPEAAEGIKVAHGGELVVAAGVESFACETLALLADQNRRSVIGAAARARMISDYSWRAQLARFDDALAQAGVKP